MNPPDAPYAVALTGASGLAYGLRLIECLIDAGCRVAVLASQASHLVAKQELGLTLPPRPSELEQFFHARHPAAIGRLRAYGREDWLAPLASGSNPPAAMAVCPCSMGSLASIAQGLAGNLIERAADVCLKEGRRLVLVPRETPFSALHLENMLRLARLGAVILPSNPGFYQHPQSIGDLVDFVVARILDQFGVPHQLSARWGGAAP